MGKSSGNAPPDFRLPGNEAPPAKPAWTPVERAQPPAPPQFQSTAPTGGMMGAMANRLRGFQQARQAQMAAQDSAPPPTIAPPPAPSQDDPRIRMMAALQKGKGPAQRDPFKGLR